MVIGDDSCSKGGGFKSRRRILDGHLEIFSHLFAIKIVLFVGKDENKQKRCRGWPIFSYWLETKPRSYGRRSSFSIKYDVFKTAPKSRIIWAAFARKFVAKNVNKCPNLVTLSD